MSEKTISRNINDLGAAAYLLMHKYRIIERKGRSFVFEVEETALKQFEETRTEYLSSEFHRFDACIMALKKMED